MVVLLIIVRVKRKLRTLFKFKFVNNVRAFRAFHQSKRMHQQLPNHKKYHLMVKRHLLRSMVKPHQPVDEVNHVKRRKLHHPEVDDAMDHQYHQIQSCIYISLPSLTIKPSQLEPKQRFLAGFKDPIHNHVGLKVIHNLQSKKNIFN